jgi:signal transduction histidine kinase
MDRSAGEATRRKTLWFRARVTAGAVPGEASEQAERFILRAFAVVRTAALTHGVFSMAGSWTQVDRPLPALAALTLILASSVTVVVTGWRRGGLRSTPVAWLDVASTITAVALVDLSLARSADPSVSNALYPYSAVALAIVGFLPVRLRWALLAAALATAGYVGVTSARFGFAALLLENAITYWAYAIATSVLAHRFRQMGVWLDGARQDAVSRERNLVEQRARAERDHERAETCRKLHDHVLQTMETLSQGVRLDDEAVRRTVSREAAWLRALIHNELDLHPPGLVAALQAVAAAHGEAGLEVQLNVASARANLVAVPVVEAVAGAVYEALTNVRKHAGVARCVVRATTSTSEVSVTVVDHGRGYDPTRVGTGVGLAQSVHERLRAVGGRACVTSRPGAGTVVELSAPAAGTSPARASLVTATSDG